MRRAFVFAGAFFPALLSAHIVDVYPARAGLRLDGGRLRVALAVNQTTWRFLGGGVPAGDWAEVDLARTADYLSRYFPVSADGVLLGPRVLSVAAKQPLWMGEHRTELYFRVVYDVPASAEKISLEALFFKEEWDQKEGRGWEAPAGAVRRFETQLRRRLGPGGAAVLSVASPHWEIPASALRRGVLFRWGESFFAGVALVWQGGAVFLWLLLLTLFPPKEATEWRRIGVPVLLAAASAFLARGGEGALWGAVLAGAAGSWQRGGAYCWGGAAGLGLAGFFRLAVGAPASIVMETGFLSFSKPLYGAGAAALFPIFWGVRRAGAALYRRYFSFLSPEEVSRQSLFHRQVAARLAGIVALYWLLSPFLDRGR